MAARSRMPCKPKWPVGASRNVVLVDAHAVVAHEQPEPPLLVSDLRADLTSLCVTRRIAQRLGRDAVDLVAHERLQRPGRAVDTTSIVAAPGAASGAQLLYDARERRREIVGSVTESRRPWTESRASAMASVA